MLCHELYLQIFGMAQTGYNKLRIILGREMLGHGIELLGFRITQTGYPKLRMTLMDA
jgi:hypothetical protein